MTRPPTEARTPALARSLALMHLATLASSPASLNALSPRGMAFVQAVRGAAKQTEGNDKPETSASWVWEDDDDDSDDNLIITADGVAIVKIMGVLVPWERRWWYGSSICSTPDTTEALEQVYDGFVAGTVKRCLLYIDSPGGITQGMKACADAIMMLRQAGCPVWAAGPEMCSCAYWLASQAGQVFLTEDGQGACIGTLIIAADASGWMTQMGIEVNRITSTGAEVYKGAGAYGTAITPEQKAMFARMCDETQALFTEAVATGRAVKLSEAQAWADGQPWGARKLLEMGLIDEIADTDDVLARITAMDVEIEAGSDPGICDEDDDDEDEGDDPPPDPLPEKSKTSGARTVKGAASKPGLFSSLPDPSASLSTAAAGGSNLPLRSGKTGGQGLPRRNPTMGFFEKLRAAKDKPETQRTDEEKDAAKVIEVGEKLTAENEKLTADNASLKTQVAKLEADAKAAGDSRDAFATLARTQVEASAVRAFGAGTVALDLAKRQIAQTTDAASLETLAADLAKTTPSPFTGAHHARVSQPVESGAVGAEDATTQDDADAKWAKQVAQRSKPGRKVAP